MISYDTLKQYVNMLTNSFTRPKTSRKQNQPRRSMPDPPHHLLPDVGTPRIGGLAERFAEPAVFS